MALALLPNNAMTFTENQHGTAVLDKLRSQRELVRCCDVILHVAGLQFQAHRCVLAACSPYFDSIFKASKTVKEQLTVSSQHPEVFRCLLAYMYTGTVVVDQTKVAELLRLANKLLLAKLKEHCAEYLQRYLDTTNCLTVRDMATKYNLESLEKTTGTFIQSHLSEVIEGEEVLDLPHTKLEEFLRSPLWEVDKSQTLLLVTRWVHHNPEARERNLRSLLTWVQWSRLNPQVAIHLIRTHPLYTSSNSLLALFFLLDALNEHSMLSTDYLSSFSKLKAKFCQTTDSVVDNESFYSLAITTAIDEFQEDPLKGGRTQDSLDPVGDLSTHTGPPHTTGPLHTGPPHTSSQHTPPTGPPHTPHTDPPHTPHTGLAHTSHAGPPHTPHTGPPHTPLLPEASQPPRTLRLSTSEDNPANITTLQPHQKITDFLVNSRRNCDSQENLMGARRDFSEHDTEPCAQYDMSRMIYSSQDMHINQPNVVYSHTASTFNALTCHTHVSDDSVGDSTSAEEGKFIANNPNHSGQSMAKNMTVWHQDQTYAPEESLSSDSSHMYQRQVYDQSFSVKPSCSDSYDKRLNPSGVFAMRESPPKSKQKFSSAMSYYVSTYNPDDDMTVSDEQSAQSFYDDKISSNLNFYSCRLADMKENMHMGPDSHHNRENYGKSYYHTDLKENRELNQPTINPGIKQEMVCNQPDIYYNENSSDTQLSNCPQDMTIHHHVAQTSEVHRDNTINDTQDMLPSKQPVLDRLLEQDPHYQHYSMKNNVASEDFPQDMSRSGEQLVSVSLSRGGLFEGMIAEGKRPPLNCTLEARGLLTIIGGGVMEEGDKSYKTCTLQDDRLYNDPCGSDTRNTIPEPEEPDSRESCAGDLMIEGMNEASRRLKFKIRRTLNSVSPPSSDQTAFNTSLPCMNPEPEVIDFSHLEPEELDPDDPQAINDSLHGQETRQECYIEDSQISIIGISQDETTAEGHSLQREREGMVKLERDNHLQRVRDDIEQWNREDSLQRDRDDSVEWEREDSVQRERVDTVVWVRENSIKFEKKDNVQRERDGIVQWEREENIQMERNYKMKSDRNDNMEQERDDCGSCDEGGEQVMRLDHDPGQYQSQAGSTSGTSKRAATRRKCTKAKPTEISKEETKSSKISVERECELCQASYTQSKKYFAHMRGHFPGPPHQCDTCDLSFKRIYHLLDHRGLHQESRHQHHHCPHCSFTTRRKFNLNQHLTSHNNLKKFKCKTCGESFVRAQILLIHETKHTQERPFLCETCGWSGKTKNALITHTKKHTGDLLRCQMSGCSYSTAKRSHLNEHMQSHSNYRPFNCQDCNRSFTTASHMRRHTKIHLPERPFTCPHCDYSSLREDRLKIHIQKKHTQKKPLKIVSRKKTKKKVSAPLTSPPPVDDTTTVITAHIKCSQSDIFSDLENTNISLQPQLPGTPPPTTLSEYPASSPSYSFPTHHHHHHHHQAAPDDPLMLVPDMSAVTEGLTHIPHTTYEGSYHSPQYHTSPSHFAALLM